MDEERLRMVIETQRAKQANLRRAGDPAAARDLFAGNAGVQFRPAAEAEQALIADEADALLAVARAAEVTR